MKKTQNFELKIKNRLHVLTEQLVKKPDFERGFWYFKNWISPLNIELKLRFKSFKNPRSEEIIKWISEAYYHLWAWWELCCCSWFFKSFWMKEREFENLKVRLKQNDHSLRQIIKSQKASGAFKKRGCIIGKHLGEKT